MDKMKKVVVCVLLFLCCSQFVFSLTKKNIRQGTCADSPQIIFLAPPADFTPRFEVAGCYCECQGKLLLLLRNPQKPQGSSWCVPGGKIEAHEKAEEALIREVKEEIGIELNPQSLSYCRPVYVRFPSVEFVLHLFHCELETMPAELNLSLEEHIDYRWVSYEEVANFPLIPGGKECFSLVFKDKLESVQRATR